MTAPLPPIELCAGGMPIEHTDAHPPESELGRHLAETRWFDPDDPYRSYERAGAELRGAILGLLPPDWSFEGRRVLDFGCGAGRILRHFLAEAGSAEIWGSDIDRPSIEWLQANLCPPLHATLNDEEPPLPFDDGCFDLVWAYSVFTHLTESWSRWACELHRVLADGGLLIATFVSAEMASFFLGRPFEQDRTGMLVRWAGAPWTIGGPLAIHSEWWIRAHWGRAFDVLSLGPIATSDPPSIRQTAAVLRRRDAAVDAERLEAPEPDEDREIAARREQIRDLSLSAIAEDAADRRRVAELTAERERAWEEYAEAMGRRDRGPGLPPAN